MIVINNGSILELFEAADPGPFMKAEITSLSGNGKLRVTCNWLYSSLNCDPDDNTQFIWLFTKIDDQHIALSPQNSCISQPIYASVRDDIGYLLQVQAPYSADWITAIGRDETIGFTLHDLNIAQFNGFNGSYITLNDDEDYHDGHSGYRLKSTGNSFSKDAQWFIGIVASLQPQISFSIPESSGLPIIS
jgi:hypothetical protein